MEDPLMKDVLLVDGVSDMVHVDTPCEFQLDYSQFIVLVRASYHALAAFDRRVVRQLSFSAYQYYCVILLWKRVLFVTASHGHMCEQHMALDDCLGYDLPIPLDVKLYLDGVGDLHYPCRGDFHLSLPLRAGGASYGRVDSRTHLAYETVPSPLVALLKIRADMAMTEEAPGSRADWDLPEDLRPTEAGATLPNRNLLCWSEAEALSETQYGLFAKAGIDASTVGTAAQVGGPLPVNRKLVLLVAAALRATANSVLDVGTSSTLGSVAQMPFTTRVARDCGCNPYRSVAEKRGVTRSHTAFSRHAASAAATFRYRLQRTVGDSEDSLCYRFATAAAPRQWLANENDVFEFGPARLLWNNGQFAIRELQGDFLASSFARRVRALHCEGGAVKAVRYYS